MRSLLKPVLVVLVLWFLAVSAFSRAPLKGYANTEPGSVEIVIKSKKLKNSFGRIAVTQPQSSNSRPFAAVAKPDIKYTTSNIYVRNITIPALAPTNTGGAVPATIYSETKVIAGTGQFGTVNGNAVSAQFKLPYGISVDADGNIFISEAGGGIRMISAAGQVSSLGTDGLPGPPFDVPKFNNPHGVVKDKNGNLFVANFNNHNILKITPSGTVSVFAGVLFAGTADGPGDVANIISPNGIAIDKDDNLYVSDGNNAIRKILPSGYVYTLAGQPLAGAADGQGPLAQFNHPGGLAVDNEGNIYVADQSNFSIRKITPNGFVTTIAGGTLGTADGIGAAAQFQHPTGITVDQSGNLYVVDNNNGTVRRIAPDGEVKTIAGGGPVGVESGVGTDVHFAEPDGIAIGPDGNLYVAEYGKNSIKQVIATGYTIDKPLPDGLTFNPRTGIITGTPTVLWPRTDYTITAYNAGGSDKFVLSIEVNDIAPPEIGAGDVSGIIATCVGSASVNYQQFTVSEINLTDDVIATAPENFEISLSPNSGYSSGVIIPLADLQLPPDGDGITVYVRSASTAPVGNPTGNVILKSTGAADVAVPVSGVVKPILTPAVTAEQVGAACPGQAVNFKANPVNGGINPVYRWFINNIDQNKTGPTFTTPATIVVTDNVTVKLTNTSDCTTSPTVTSPPLSPVYKPSATPSITITQADMVCPGEVVTFNASPQGGGANPTYRWLINGVYQNNATGLSFIAPATIAATDKINAELTNTTDCTSQATVSSLPLSPAYKQTTTPTVTVTQAFLVCPGQTVTFNASPQSQGTNPAYRWLLNGVYQEGVTGLSFAAPATITTADKITFELTNTTDCTSQPTVVSAPISPVYKPIVTPTVTVTQATAAVCPGQVVSFNANPQNEGTNPIYRWMINGVYQSNFPGPSFIAPATITAADKITVQLFNMTDCLGSGAVLSPPVSPVYSIPTPLAVSVFAPAVYPVCEGTSQTFTATVSPNNVGSLTYQWQLNQVNVGSNSNQYTSSTLKNGDALTCTVSTGAQCTVPSTSNGFTVQTLALPTVAFNGDVFIKKGESVTVFPSVSGNVVNYNWSPSIGLNNPVTQNPIASPTETTIYTLTITSAGGCPASASIKVNVLDQMVVPNTFTPNGDGVNDTWSIPALAAYPDCRVNVYNRYGAGIFTSIGYAKNWNGSFNGYVLPAGTYYYTIDLKDGKKPLSGYVVLLK